MANTFCIYREEEKNLAEEKRGKPKKSRKLKKVAEPLRTVSSDGFISARGVSSSWNETVLVRFRYIAITK